MPYKILEKINRAALNLLVPLKPNEIYEVVVREAIKLVNAQYGSLILLQNKEFKRVHTSLPNGEEPSIRRKGLTYRAITEKKAFVVHGSEIRSMIAKKGIQSSIFIPLDYRGATIGALIVNSLKNVKFSYKELHILKLFGSMASLAIKKTQLYEETRQALETRDLFIALAAHELRTPLTSVNGYAQLLLRRLGEKDTTEAKWVKELSLECKRLTEITSELLTVNLVKSGQLQFNFQETNLLETIERAIREVNFVYPDRKIILNNLVKEKKILIPADANKLLQVITNIIENAMKFSSQSRIPVEVMFKSKLNTYLIQITDHGKGMNEKDLTKLFDVFYKGSNRNEEQGLGLGLYLAKYIIEAHHGEIVISSKVDKGTKVTITLPRLSI